MGNLKTIVYRQIYVDKKNATVQCIFSHAVTAFILSSNVCLEKSNFCGMIMLRPLIHLNDVLWSELNIHTKSLKLGLNNDIYQNKIYHLRRRSGFKMASTIRKTIRDGEYWSAIFQCKSALKWCSHHNIVIHIEMLNDGFMTYKGVDLPKASFTSPFTPRINVEDAGVVADAFGVARSVASVPADDDCCPLVDDGRVNVRGLFTWLF